LKQVKTSKKRGLKNIYTTEKHTGKRILKTDRKKDKNHRALLPITGKHYSFGHKEKLQLLEGKETANSNFFGRAG
jgi:hypothetical protein